MRDIEIIPAILPSSIEDLESSLARVRNVARMVQIDIVDGKFAENTTWPYQGDDGTYGRVIREESGFPFWHDFDFEFDLMVCRPESVIADWIAAGGSRIVIHEDSAPHDVLYDILKEWGHVVDIGIALTSQISVDDMSGLIRSASFVQCMGIRQVGFQGQPFDSSILETIRSVRKMFPEIPISVDGGVQVGTAASLVSAGATRLVAGSAVFKGDNPSDAIDQLRDVAEGVVDNGA